MSGNYPGGMTSATLLPGEYFSPSHGGLIDPPECEICGAPMRIIEDTSWSFHAVCEARGACADCGGSGIIPTLCSWHEHPTLTTIGGDIFPTRDANGRCNLCLCFGNQPGIYDEWCQRCVDGIADCPGVFISEAA